MALFFAIYKMSKFYLTIHLEDNEIL